MTLTIPLTKGYSALVDDEDADLASFHWCAVTGKSGISYAVRSIRIGMSRNTSVYMHRVILERMCGQKLMRQQLTDHKNRNGLVNCRWNLRLATGVQNAQNSGAHRDSTSGIRGIHWDTEREKWRAQIMVNRKYMHLGMFTDLNDALSARALAEAKYYGEFANSGTEAQHADS